MSVTQTATTTIPLSTLNLPSSQTAAPTASRPQHTGNGGSTTAASQTTGTSAGQNVGQTITGSPQTITSNVASQSHAPAAPPVALNATAVIAPPAAQTATAVTAPPKKKSHGISAATWLGVGFAAGALIIGIYYGEPMLRLAKWTAMKDFHESCVEDRGVGLSSAACNATLAEPMRPPPIVKRSYPAAVHDILTGYWSALVTLAIGLTTLLMFVVGFRRHMETRPKPVVSMVRNDAGCYVTTPTLITRHEEVMIVANDEVDLSAPSLVTGAPKDTDNESLLQVVRSMDGTGQGNRTATRRLLNAALRTANAAASLDTALKYQDAIVEYDATCKLLKRVIQRTSCMEDQRKLQALHTTYLNRSEELRHSGPNALSFPTPTDQDSDNESLLPKVRVTHETNHRRGKTSVDLLKDAFERVSGVACRLDDTGKHGDAVTGYESSCNLLQQIIERTPGTHDQRQLQIIRERYLNRIEELVQLRSESLSTSVEGAIADTMAPSRFPIAERRSTELVSVSTQPSVNDVTFDDDVESEPADDDDDLSRTETTFELSSSIRLRILGPRPASAKRNKEFHTLFPASMLPDDDLLIDDCTASTEGALLPGRLYISQHHLCFRSSRFGRGQDFVISFKDLCFLEKESSMSAGLITLGSPLTLMSPLTSLTVGTLTQQWYTFSNLVSGDSVYDSLVSIWGIYVPTLRKTTNVCQLPDERVHRFNAGLNAALEPVGGLFAVQIAEVRHAEEASDQSHDHMVV